MTAMRITDIPATFSGLGRRLQVLCTPAARIYRNLLTSQWWSEEQFRAYQLRQLRMMINRAYESVPYYRTMMEVYGLHPDRIRTPEDLRLLPILSRDDVQQYYRELVSEDRLWSFVEPGVEGPSPGLSIPIYYDMYNLGFETALMRRQRRWAGLSRWERYATLKNEKIASPQLKRGLYWHFSMLENTLRMSAHHLSERTAGRYIWALRHYQPRALDGYPSAIYVLARVMLNRNIRFPLAAVLTSSETLLPVQKSVIEKAFVSRVYDYYDMRERAAAIHSCEHGRYHIVSEYSLVELIENEEERKTGYYEIVGTSLTNRVMPMIRYRVGDLVKLSKKSCPCGRRMPVVERIIGRSNDYVVTPSGQLFGRLDHILRQATNLRDVQIYQPDREHLVLRIVPDRYFKDHDGAAILEKLRKVLGEDICVEIERHSSIPGNGGAKHKTILSDVNAFAEL